MKSAALLLSSSVAYATRRAEPSLLYSLFLIPYSLFESRLRSLLGVLLVSIFLTNNLNAQTDTTVIEKPEYLLHGGEIVKKVSDSSLFNKKSILLPEQKKKRIWLVAGGNVVGYSTVMAGLYSAWYKNYPQSSFHFFNDNMEWLQVDKVGHMYSAYIESRASMELWRWTGIDRKKRIWIGGMSGAFYQTVIEVLDGFSAEWGWSWGDFSANILGSSALVAQELAWNDQRIKLKFSFHNRSYSDPTLNQRSHTLFGNSTAQEFIKDYNGQTYWASTNLRSFFPKSKLPPWLSLSVGYGADGMFGASANSAKDKNGNIIFNRPDIKRYRQWYLAPDIDLSKIKTKSKPLKFFLTFLSAFKFPAPALEFSKGKFKVHAIYF